MWVITLARHASDKRTRRNATSQRNDLYRIKQLKAIKGTAASACTLRFWFSNQSMRLRTLPSDYLTMTESEDNQLINLWIAMIVLSVRGGIFIDKCDDWRFAIDLLEVLCGTCLYLLTN